MMPDPEQADWFKPPASALLPALNGQVEADAVVVGGGIAGLAAAERLSGAGLRVIILEAGACGGGATGRSSGFITADSELQLADLARRFGDGPAAAIYTRAREACAHIRLLADRHAIPCDLIDSDCLYAAGDPRSVGTIRREHQARVRFGLDSTLLEGPAVRSAIATGAFPAAVRYGSTFGIRGAPFCTGYRDALRARGVLVYEGSPAVSVAPREARTPGGAVRADQVLVCVDRSAPGLGLAQRAVYRAAAFLLLTEPLEPGLLASLFPGGPLMVWDTDLIYQYFRPTPDGRLLIGGGSLARVFARNQRDGRPVHEKLARSITRIFPALAGVGFTHRWSGLIGVTKDILPLAGPAPGLPGIHLALAAAGIPWAMLAGQVAAESALGRPGPALLDPARAFTTIDPLQPILGRELTWMLASSLARGFERGGSDRVRTRQRALLLGTGAALAAAGLAAARRLAR